MARPRDGINVYRNYRYFRRHMMRLVDKKGFTVSEVGAVAMPLLLSFLTFKEVKTAVAATESQLKRNKKSKGGD